MAEAICRSLVECGCRGVSDEAACTHALADVLTVEHAAAEMTSLVYDEACLQSRIDTLAEQRCMPDGTSLEDILRMTCEPRCQLFHGGARAGEPCQWYGNLHDCQQGLECMRLHNGEDRCVLRCGEEGDVCPTPFELASCNPFLDLVCSWPSEGGPSTCVRLPTVGEPCPMGECASEAYCQFSVPRGEVPLCRARPQPGESCDEAWCVEGAWCTQTQDGERVCALQPKLGEPCADVPCNWFDSLCDHSLDSPRCVPYPAVGEPCVEGVCVEGAFCDETAEEPTCAMRRGGGEPCSNPEECLSYRCRQGLCTSPAAVCKLTSHLPSLQ